MSSLVNDVRASEEFQKFKKIVERAKSKADIDGGMAEALSLHTSRLSRGLRGKDRYSPHVLIDASLQDMSNRARLVELRVKNDVQLETVNEAIHAMARYIATEYAEDLRDEFKTAAQRNAFADRVMKNAKKYLADGQAFIATLDTLIKDIDQAGYNIKAAIECLKLLEGSKAGRVV